MNGKFSTEKLIHFNCAFCNKWFSIGDAPLEKRKEWYCPWCGKKQVFEKVKK